jgi:hypothetical protein
MTNQTAKFSDAVTAAQFCAELTRQGIAFELTTNQQGWFIVEITGY